MVIDLAQQTYQLISFNKQWIVVGSLHGLDLEEYDDSVSVMQKFLNALDLDQKTYIFQHGLQWKTEQSFSTLTWHIAVQFAQEHAVEYMLRWR
jgi:hypothetical protein